MVETIASGTTVSNISLGTQQILDVYGTANTVAVGALAEVNVYSGGEVEHVDLALANATEYVFAGGVNNFGTLSNGEMIVDGGVDSGSVINGASDENLENGGISHNLLEASPTATSFEGGENIYAGSKAFNTTIENYFNQNVNSGGSAIDTTVDSGGALYGYKGSTIQSALINLGGSLAVEGLAQNVTLNGGVGTVDGGGQSTNMLVNSGGTLTINSLSSATFTTVMSHGFEFLSGGSATGTQLEGGFEAVESGGVDQAATINSGSRLGVDSGGMANLTAIKNGGYERVLSGGTAGNIAISAGGTLEVDSGGILLGTIDLGGTLIINDLDQAIVSFGGTGELVFDSMYFYSGGTARITNDTLIVKDNGTIFTQTLTGNYSDYTPVIEDVSLYGVDVVGITLVSTAPCFAAGTRILTPRGEIAVENLVIGDMVITKEGDDAPIKWIGKRKLDLSRHPHPEQVQPIFFEEDCLAEGVPSRDLILSPDHALYLDGVLVPAKALVNGQNIRQLNRQTVTYYHIELEKHSIIFSESTPVETYLETGNRGAFENGTDALTLHPDLAQTMREEQSCAPFVETGPVVWAIRIRTLQRQYSTYKSGQRRYNA